MPKSYLDKLKDPRWQRKRLEVLQRDDWTCQSCFAPNDGPNQESLHVHHRWYDYGKEPWDYSDDCFTTLCETCHDSVSRSEKWFKEIGKRFTVQTILALHSFVEDVGDKFDNEELFSLWLFAQQTILGQTYKTSEIFAAEVELFQRQRAVLQHSGRK